jgi:GntR family transcriptional regulator, transcriptional repressor for pyruvate dehydrogenase complex
MHEERIQLMAKATGIACKAITSPHLAALQDSLNQACGVPMTAQWDRRAAAHARFFNVLANVSDHPRSGPVLDDGARLAYELMLAAGRNADGMVITSRRQLLRCLRAGDAEQAAAEMEKHLRVLQFMWRLAGGYRTTPP